MKHNLILTAIILLIGSTIHADGWTVLDGGWRISAGVACDPGVRGDLKYLPHMKPYVSPYVPGRTRAAALKALTVAPVEGRTGAKTRYEVGGSWIDRDDPVASSGYDVGLTRYYQIPESAYMGNGEFLIGSEAYSEVTVAEGHTPSLEEDETACAPGISIELSRNLYHDPEYGWGVDAVFGVNYFRRNDLLGSTMAWFAGASERRAGHYDSVASTLTGGTDDWNWHGEGADRFYGSGSYSGNAGPISWDPDSPRMTETVSRDSSYGYLRSEGDYENLDLMLTARPYYDIFTWLRVNTMLGVVVSRQELDLTMRMMTDGVYSHRSQNFSQWNCYGVGGAGLMLYYNDFTLSCDIFARFLDKSLDVDNDYVTGSVERGDWFFKLSLGYEF